MAQPRDGFQRQRELWGVVSVNVRQTFSSDYVVLHRATCPHVSGPRESGAFTERDYRKLCGATLADVFEAPTRCGRATGGVHEALLALLLFAGDGLGGASPRSQTGGRTWRDRIARETFVAHA